MTYNIPTLKELTEKTRGYINTYLPNTDSFLTPNILGVFGKVWSMMIYPVYGYGNYILNQMFAVTADTQYLELHASERGLSRRSATKSSGYVRVIGASGQTIALNALLNRSDGVQFIAKTALLTTGNNLLLVESLSAGANKNTNSGTKLELNTVNPNITSITVTDGLSGGSDIETDESLRLRVSYAKQNLAYTGTLGYYNIKVQQEFSDVTRIFRENGLGTFNLYFLMDDKYDNGIPSGSDISAIQTYLNTIKLEGTNPVAKAPQLQVINVVVNISGIITNETQAQIELEIKDAIESEGQFSSTDDPKVFYKESIDSAVGRVLVGNNFNVISPNANISIASGKIPAYGTVTINTVT